MSKIVKETENQIKNAVFSAMKTAIEKGDLTGDMPADFTIEVPQDRTHGDYAVNAAMVSARNFKIAPRKIAEIICENLNTENTCIKSFEIAGPGFINFFLTDLYYSSILKDVEMMGDDYGQSEYGENKKVLIEFVSANPTGPMHIGNARGGALGDCLASVMQKAGFDVSREFYVNDAGNQIEKFKISLEARYLQLFDSSVEIPEDAYLGGDIIEHAENFKKLYGDKYVNADSDERKQALCDYALPLNIQKLHDDLEKYRIIYDCWFKESELHSSGAVADIIEKLKASGHTYEQDGALWFKSTDFGEDKDRVLVRANGVVTYFVPDIAYHYNKLVTRGYDLAIDVLGADHHGYVPRMKGALTALGIDENRLDAIIMQMVRLVKNGETYKLSKRSGKAVTLETLLDEVPIDAARLFFNLREPNTHFEFDLDLAVKQESQNPVYYVQYAHARICSIIRNLKAQGIDRKQLDAEQLCVLTAPEERELIRHIAAYTDNIIASAKDYNPAVITRYVIDLATLFHKFYNACPVKSAEDNLKYARLELCTATASVLRNALSLLKIDAPEKM